MQLYIELSPKTIVSSPRTHKLELESIPAYKNYVQGQVLGPGNERPSWALVKTTPEPSTERTALYFVGAVWHEGKLRVFERVYDKSFLEIANKPKEKKNAKK